MRSLRFRLGACSGIPAASPGSGPQGFNHEYERQGTTLLAALNVATGQVKAGHYPRRRRRELWDFMNEVGADDAQQEIGAGEP